RDYDYVYSVPPPEWLGVFSLGDKEALANLLWVRALIYFGDEVRYGKSAADVARYGGALVTLDPEFRRVYRWEGTTLLFRPGVVSISDVRRAVAFLERGARQFPEDPEIAWDLGATLAYELAPRLRNQKESQRVREK